MGANKHKWWKGIVFVLLVLDAVYTFKQFYGKPFDGDLVPVVLPSEYYQKVLDDPLGFRAFIYHEKYNATNRYFCHKTMHIWFRDVHAVAASFFNDKVSALYVVSALFSLLVYVLLLMMIVKYITLDQFKWWMLLLAVPFIQVNGYTHIALLDNAITYTFFYAYPVALLLLYALPFYRAYITKESMQFSWLKHILWLMLAFYLSLGGTLVQPLILLIGLFIGVYNITLFKEYREASKIKQVFNLYKTQILHFSFFFVLCLYSYYISRYNAEIPESMPTLKERYALWFKGMFIHFSHTPVYLFLFSIILIPIPFLQQSKLEEKEQMIIRFSKWLILFCVIYVCILPLGGYRPYRPYIVRYDLMIPVNFVFILYAASSVYLSVKYKAPMKILVPIIVAMLIFQMNDKPHFHANACEKTRLRELQNYKGDTLILANDCKVLQWTDEFSQYHANDISKMLYEWKITKKQIYYSQE